MPGAFGPCGPVVEGPPRRGSSTKAQRPPRRRRSSARPDAIGAGPCAGGETLGRCRNSGIIGIGIYTSLHDIWFIISYYIISYHIISYHIISYHIISYHLSIYLSIHPSTYPHTSANIIAGRFFVWWLVFNFAYCCFYLEIFMVIFVMGGIQLLAYYCILLSDMGSWGW